MMTWASYPYTGSVGTCKAKAGVITTTGWVVIPPNDSTALLNAVAQRPVSVGVAASSGSFFFYKSGVLDTTSCGTRLNHAVTIVGYG